MGLGLLVVAPSALLGSLESASGPVPDSEVGYRGANVSERIPESFPPTSDDYNRLRARLTAYERVAADLHAELQGWPSADAETKAKALKRDFPALSALDTEEKT